MVKIGLIRHARTSWNLKKKIQGREDLALCPEGIQEAGFWGEILKFEKYDLILSSTMIRAQQTSQIISDKINVNIEYDRDLREQNFGEWEGKRIIDIRKETPDEIKLQESRGWAFCPPEGESRTMVLKRVLRAVSKVTERFDNKNILIVSHNSVMKILIYKLLNRTFTPDASPLLKDYHLHVLALYEKLDKKMDKKLKIEKLNYIKL